MPRTSANPAPAFDCLAAMRALGEPSRIRIVRHLLDGPHSATELCEGLGLQPYNASRHLAVLKAAGLVDVEKSAQQRIYSLAMAIRDRLTVGGRILDLGCCRFDLDQFPE